MVFRLDHCIGDGIGCMHLFANMVSDQNGIPLASTLLGGSKTQTKRPSPALSQLIPDLKEVIMTPHSPFDSSILFTSPAKQNLRYSGSRKIIEFPNMSLVDIKALKNRADCTVNDVLLSVTSGAIRRYCVARDDPEINKDGLLMRSLTAFSLPRKNTTLTDHRNALYNKFTLVSSRVCLEDVSAMQRLAATSATMTALKGSWKAFLTFHISDKLMPYLPFKASIDALYGTFSRHSMVFSNVPGPQMRCFLAGQEVKSMGMLFPNLIPQVGIMSFNGCVTMNMTVDDEVITQPTLLIDAFQEEYQALAKELNVTLSGL